MTRPSLAGQRCLSDPRHLPETELWRVFFRNVMVSSCCSDCSSSGGSSSFRCIIETRRGVIHCGVSWPAGAGSGGAASPWRTNTRGKYCNWTRPELKRVYFLLRFWLWIIHFFFQKLLKNINYKMTKISVLFTSTPKIFNAFSTILRFLHTWWGGGKPSGSMDVLVMYG